MTDAKSPIRAKFCEGLVWMGTGSIPQDSVLPFWSPIRRFTPPVEFRGGCHWMRCSSHDAQLRNIVAIKTLDLGKVPLSDLLKLFEVGVRNLLMVDHLSEDGSTVLFTSLCLPIRRVDDLNGPSDSNYSYSLVHVASSGSDGKESTIPILPVDTTPGIYQSRVKTLLEYELSIGVAIGTKDSDQQRLARRQSFVTLHNNYNKYGGQIFVPVVAGPAIKAAAATAGQSRTVQLEEQYSEWKGILAPILPSELYTYCGDLFEILYRNKEYCDDQNNPMYPLVPSAKWVKPTVAVPVGKSVFASHSEASDACSTFWEVLAQSPLICESAFSFGNTVPRKGVKRKPTRVQQSDLDKRLKDKATTELASKLDAACASSVQPAVSMNAAPTTTMTSSDGDMSDMDAFLERISKGLSN